MSDPDAPATVLVTVEMSAELRGYLSAKAEADRVSTSEVVQVALGRYAAPHPFSITELLTKKEWADLRFAVEQRVRSQVADEIFQYGLSIEPDRHPDTSERDTGECAALVQAQAIARAGRNAWPRRRGANRPIPSEELRQELAEESRTPGF